MDEYPKLAYLDQDIPQPMAAELKLSHSDYTVGWVCALPMELAAAKAMLDKAHPTLRGLHRTDENVYTLGSIGGQNIAVACNPAGVYGSVSAAGVIGQMLSSFPFFEIFLMVGIGGGVPSEEHDIRLGNVVIGAPSSESAGIFHYDPGQDSLGILLDRKGTLNKPPPSLLSALSRARTNHELKTSNIPYILTKTLARYPTMKERFAYPGQDHDILMEEGQTRNEFVIANRARWIKIDYDPMVRNGRIASGNQVMKDGRTRDRPSRDNEILCLEIAAPELMSGSSCIVIRGICDYSDAYRQKDFQKYAALTAAGCAVELLYTMPYRAPEASPSVTRDSRNACDDADDSECDSIESSDTPFSKTRKLSGDPTGEIR